MNKAIIFFHILLLSTIEVSDVFNVSSSQAITNLSKRRFLHEQFLVSNYSPTLITHTVKHTHTMIFSGTPIG